jgi:hypothetical protein
MPEDDDIEEMARISPLVHFATYQQIYTKKNKAEHPKPNILQQRINQAIWVLKKLNHPVRLLVTKIRQCGGSTYALQTAYHEGRTRKIDCVIIADVGSNSQKMLERLNDSTRLDSFPWKNTMRSILGKTTCSNGSTFEMDSAERWNAGISRTRQVVVFSETPKWPRTGVKNDNKVAHAVMPSVPREPDTIVISEGTPNGASGWQYNQWIKALWLDEYVKRLQAGESQPGNGWVKIFAAWFEFTELVLKVSDQERAEIRRTLTTRESKGIQMYGWTEEQIAWRRATIASECGGSEKSFDEYYPEDDLSCWLGTGRPRFDQAALMHMERRLSGLNPLTGRLLLQDDGATVNWAPCPDGTGDIQIWEEPREGMKYVVWVDPATGEDQTESNNPDRHSIGVLRAPYIDQNGNHVNAAIVARVKAPFQGEGDMVAMHAANLAYHYGQCLIVLEVNMGLHVLTNLKLRGCLIYKREVPNPIDREKPTMMFGFKTKDQNTKHMLTDALAVCIREGSIDINDPHAIGECRAFMIGKNGVECAPAGQHDDDVIGLGMAVFAMGSATSYVEPVRRRKKPKDWRAWEQIAAGVKK